MGKQKQVLIIYTRDICYHSSEFFLHQLQVALDEAGAVCTFLDVSTDDYDVLDSLLENVKAGHVQYDALFDLNSRLPLLETEDGEPFLNALGIPFYNWIVDHPLYHHNVLAAPIADYHVWTVDRCHASYVKKHYPHIKSVEYVPLPGCVAENVKQNGKENVGGVKCVNRAETIKLGQNFAVGEIVAARSVRTRKHRILAPLTYQIDEALALEWEGLSRKIQNVEMKQRLEKLMCDSTSLWNPSEETLEAYLERYLSKRNQMPNNYGVVGFRELMNHIYVLDKYMRNHRRYAYIEAIARAGLPIDLLGEGWEDTPLASYYNVRLLTPVPIEESYEIIASYDVLLDVNPLFFDGVHDRVPAALLNGTFVLSSMSPNVDASLTQETGVYYFSGTESLLAQCKVVLDLAEIDGAKNIRARARTAAEKNYTWKHVAEVL